MRALANPALQVLAGLITLFAFTWPLLAFDRPLYVFLSFYGVWLSIIVLLFVLSRAEERAETFGLDEPDEADEADEAEHA